jgi:hypothetical protein
MLQASLRVYYTADRAILQHIQNSLFSARAGVSASCPEPPAGSALPKAAPIRQPTSTQNATIATKSSLIFPLRRLLASPIEPLPDIFSPPFNKFLSFLANGRLQ